MIIALLDFFKNIEWPSIIIGAIVGAFIPVVAKWLLSFFKDNKEKYHLSSFCRNAHTYKSMSEGDVSVNIYYKGEKYDDSISIIEIGLVNDGQNDLSFANHFDKPILIRSSTYKIIEVQNISEDKIKANVFIDSEGIVRLSWGLLKKDERIIVRIVGVSLYAESTSQKNDSSFFDSLSLIVRSDCVDYIAPRRMPIKQLIWMTSLAVVLLAGIHYWIWDKNDIKIEEYTFKYEDDIFTGSLKYDKEADTYFISPLDSLEKHSNYWNLKYYPQITSSAFMNKGTFVLIYVVVWLLMVLFFVLVARSDNKQKDKLIFKE